jgi:hypothetical protein
MLSKLSNLQGVKMLSKNEQRDLKGGSCLVCLYGCCVKGPDCPHSECWFGSCDCRA